MQTNCLLRTRRAIDDWCAVSLGRQAFAAEVQPEERMLAMCSILMSSSARTMLSSLAKVEVWAAVVLVVIPTALACGTVIVLVLAVDRKNRVQAIKALSPLVYGLTRQARTRTTRHLHLESDMPHGRGEVASGTP